MPALMRDATRTFEATREQSEEVARALAHVRGEDGDRDRPVGLRMEADGRDVDLPPESAAVVMAVLSALADGQRIEIVAMPKELTTTAAADMLGMSRPTLMKMVQAEEVPSHKVGTHTRFLTEDIVRIRDERDARARSAFERARAAQDAAGIDE